MKILKKPNDVFLDPIHQTLTNLCCPDEQEAINTTMDFSLKKPFKTYGSAKHRRGISSGGACSGDDPNTHEELPILFHSTNLDDRQHPPTQATGEVVVKVDASGGGNGTGESSSYASASSFKLRKEPSFDFVQHQGNDEQHSPKAIGRWLNKRLNDSVGEISLEMGLDMDELSQRESLERKIASVADTPLHKFSSRETRVSMEPSLSGSLPSSSEFIRRRYKDSPMEGNDQEGIFDRRPQQHRENRQQKRSDEVLRCSSFKSQASLLSSRPKSRLLSPSPEEVERMSAKIPRSGQLRSGLLSKALESEEDDPLADEDFPDDFRKAKLNTLTVLQWVSLVAIIGALVCSLTIPALKEETFLRLKLWKWEVLLLVLICGRLVSGWGIRIIVFFIERNFLLRKRVLYFVYGLRRGVQNCWWLGLVLLAWHFLFDKKVERETKSDVLKYVTKVLVCFLVANFIWLFKTLMVKVLASSFHVSTYFDRIQESVFNQFVIETLSGPPMIELQNNEEEIERTAAEVRRLQNAGATVPPDLKSVVYPPPKSERPVASGSSSHKSLRGKSNIFSRQLSKNEEKKGDEGIKIDHLNKLNTNNISAWNMKRLMNIVKHGSLSTLDEQILCATTNDESATQIKNEYEAKAAARKIFFNVARPGSKYIYLEDLLRFMQENEALKTMCFFEGVSETGKISKSSLKNWVVSAFRERRALALTLNDTKTAVNKLHHIINAVVGAAIIVIWIVILGIATSRFIVFIGSQIVVASFIFGNTARILFESVIFLFIVHPFDVGDRCEVDGMVLIVEEMNILTTVFLKENNMKLIYHNSILVTKAIGNHYRSPDMAEAIDITIHISTPEEKISALKQRITSYIQSKKEHWYPAVDVVVKDIEEMQRLKIAVWPQHRINNQDSQERWLRRGALVEAILSILKELDIPFQAPLMPVDVNVRAMPSLIS